MRTLIFEGIASSGKTTIEQNLVKFFASQRISCNLIDENTTLMPILDNKDRQTSIKFLNDVLDKVYKNPAQIIIFDRLYFTHIITTNSTLENFKSIENRLLQYNPTIIFLKVDEHKIPERILWAMEHRDEKWLVHVKKKGTNEQIFEYYKNQQRKIEELTKQTALPLMVMATSDLDFDKVSQKIFNDIVTLG